MENRLERPIYENPVYSRRKDTDRLLELPVAAVSDSVAYRTCRFVSDGQLRIDRLWKLFAEQFTVQDDSENYGWRGEYWGKMMRGGCFVYRVTGDSGLYLALRKAVLYILNTADSDGRISSYKREKELCGWDMWSRKYILLGLQYFYDICPEEALRNRIIAAMCAHLNYITERIGPDEGKKSILDSSHIWGSVNSCSILEPVVRLYNLTDDKKYLDFAEYIISTGGSNLGNLPELALKNEIPPYKYPVVKAYETMSFFEGILEYYRITGEEKYLTAVLNFTDAVLATDYTLIGNCGCTHELFDNSSECQTEDRTDIMQETCVAVTLSKLLFQCYLITGNPRYADAIETTYYNTILGSINFEGNKKLNMDPALSKRDYSHVADFVNEIGGFMFDSYSPLYKKSRNRKTGGFQTMDGNKAYGCCACIGAAGTAILPFSAVTMSAAGPVIGQYIEGKFDYSLPEGGLLTVETETGYPFTNTVKMTVTVPEYLIGGCVSLRIPSYGNAVITLGGKHGKTFDAKAGTFFELPVKSFAQKAEGLCSAVIAIEFDEQAVIISKNDKIAVKKGCIVMAADSRIADIDAVLDDTLLFDLPGESSVQSRLCREMVFGNGTKITLIDYASAGACWDDPADKVTAWFDSKKA
ncbi:MAG: glycoside hydrolase family 127 protein [Clostridia bacterium]|nr:glycoside hydrolase family 127 protein [Clostridia bacterium]